METKTRFKVNNFESDGIFVYDTYDEALPCVKGEDFDAALHTHIKGHSSKLVQVTGTITNVLCRVAKDNETKKLYFLKIYTITPTEESLERIKEFVESIKNEPEYEGPKKENS